MIHIIYDMNDGVSVPDNKVQNFAADMVWDLGTIDEVVEVRVGQLNIIRSVAYAMKHRNIPHTNLTISYAHSDSKIWLNEDYHLDGVFDFCTHDIDVLMDML